MATIQLSAGPVEYDDHGDGPPVVLLHGLHMDGGLWRRVVPRLEGHRRLVPTLPLGAHRTPMGDGADLTPRGVARLVGEFLDRLGLDDVTLVGSDTGGALAQLLLAEAAAHPATPGAGRVGRLVLVSCEAFGNFPPGLPGRVSAAAARLPGGLALAAQSMRLPLAARLPITWGWMARRPVPRDLLDDWFRPLRSSRGVRRDLAAFVRAIPDADLTAAAAHLAAFRGPALVVWAGDDRVMPPAHARRLAACFADGRYVTVADSYTLVPLDQPAVLARHIAGFARAAGGPPTGRRVRISDLGAFLPDGGTSVCA
ncbi:alpha/beta fold hydrolase [Jiangella rhizosphaerae]|uniref:Alpha/beta hydrolase n=1 Tax=Jiangella rhizosphaerae TaxID=2293569 RepID=A0A418KJB0_9ACTN|nr:alpha/beta hydrolase [Jiangella rhizosphaerae]RIQ13730.1 alpha/beta hydrolase [Jiangella rhizosphaerae]